MQLLLYIYTNQYGFCQRIGGLSRKMSVFGKTARVFRKTTAVFGKTHAVFFKTRAVLSEYLCDSIVSQFLLTSAPLLIAGDLARNQRRGGRGCPRSLSWPQAARCDCSVATSGVTQV